MNNDEAVLRKFEADVLDRHHLTLPLWVEQPSRRLWGLLAAYDSFALSHYSVQNHPKSVYAIQRMKHVHEALSVVLRWHFSDAPSSFPSPEVDSKLLEMAGTFILHAADHFLLSNMHSIYGRGGLRIECDDRERVVRFIPNGKEIIPPWHVLAESHISEEIERAARATTVERLGELSTHLNVTLSDGRIVLLEPEQLATLGILDEASNLVPVEYLPLDEDTSIANFSMRTFRRFWLALDVWSFCAIQLYLGMALSGVDQAECMPTQILLLPDFIEVMQMMTRASRAEVEAIVKLLAFDPTNVKADAILQPFITSHNEIAWSALAVRLSKPERNLLKLMSRSPQLTAHAANLIGARERHLLEEIGRFLAKRGGFQYKLNQTISVNGERAEIDLLAYAVHAPEELLIIEAKAILAVDDVNEVAESARVLRRAEDQLRRSAKLIEDASAGYLTSVFRFVDWARIQTIHRLIVTPDTPPSSTFDDSNTPAVSFLTIKQSFRNRDLKTPARLCAAAHSRPREVTATVTAVEYERLKVGDVTYEVAVASL